MMSSFFLHSPLNSSSSAFILSISIVVLSSSFFTFSSSLCCKVVCAWIHLDALSVLINMCETMATVTVHVDIGYRCLRECHWQAQEGTPINRQPKACWYSWDGWDERYGFWTAYSFTCVTQLMLYDKTNKQDLCDGSTCNIPNKRRVCKGKSEMKDAGSGGGWSTERRVLNPSRTCTLSIAGME